MADSVHFDLPCGSTLDVLLFPSVINGEEIQEALKAHTCPDMCLLAADRVVDPWLVAVAAHTAVDRTRSGCRLRTASLHAETLYCLWPGRNMVAAFKEFGPRAECADVLVAVLDATPATLAAVRALIRCDPSTSAVSLDDYYPSRVDMPWVRKLYAITDEELAFGSVLDAAVSKLATDDLPKVSQLAHLK